MGKITFILGGARSGKSSFALGLAQKCRQVAFVATAQALDKEMRQRIRMHQKARPGPWRTFEQPLDLAALLKKDARKFEIVIIDCLTLWISNLLLEGIKAAAIENRAREVIRQLKKIKGRSILVANEVGLGIVPENKLARDFRDIAGRINQIAAQEADEVFFMAAGLPLRLK